MLILMSVCYLSSPFTCREERLHYAYEETGVMGCLVRSQAAIAVWRDAHPEVRIDHWRCVPRSRVETPL